MLSPKARAFCVENLLGLSSADSRHDVEQTTEKKRETEYVPLQISGQNLYTSSIPVYEIDAVKERLLLSGLDTPESHQDNSGTKCITVDLLHNDLWRSFHSLGTEMIITKSGRRMFPAVRVRLRGLDPNSRYKIYMDFTQLDRNKYRYVYHSSKWMISGSGDTMISNQVYNHPDSPMDSNFLNSQIVSFERIKLTNNEKTKPGQVSLMSMQRFQPRIHIQKLCDNLEGVSEQFTVIFPQTSFIAVTAYQNQEITRLKIARNPFAKGFREAGKNRSSLEAMMEFYGLQLHNSDIIGKELTRKASKKVITEDINDKRKTKRLNYNIPYEFTDDNKCYSDSRRYVGNKNIYNDGPTMHIKTENPFIPSYCNSALKLEPRQDVHEDYYTRERTQSCSGNYSSVISVPGILTLHCQHEQKEHSHYGFQQDTLQRQNMCCNYVSSEKNYSYPR